MSTKAILDGNRAIAQAVRLSRVQVISTYPITPQSSIAETLAEMVSRGEMLARYLRVESEHSALAAAVGAALVGARVFTATSSVGLALMYEVLGVAAGCRVPVVMGLVNRALLAPWNIWGDQSDAMAVREQGWLSLFAATPQEALDLTIMAYRIAEDPRILLPVMVSIDGFFLSHVTESLWLPDQDEVDSFLRPHPLSPVRLDPDEPMVVNPLTPPSQYTEVRYEQSQALDRAQGAIDEVMEDFACHFGRSYHQLQTFGDPQGDLVLIALGSVCGTIQHVLREEPLLAEGVRFVKLTSLRPFPSEQLRQCCQGTQIVGVVDRAPALGHLGPLASEVKTALYDLKPQPRVVGFVAGLGGRDISPGTVRRMIKSLIEVKGASQPPTKSLWVDLQAGGMP
jgi:pyruvate ferredoxin oxidoreductase alpha subunit